MNEPDIVFCKFNHIYDAALHAECPYCKKIKEDQEALSKSLVEGIGASATGDEESSDATELLMPQMVDEDESTELLIQSEDEGDSTELLIQSEDEGESTELLIQSEDEDDSTELLIQPEDEDDSMELLDPEQVVRVLETKEGSLLKNKNLKNASRTSKPVLGWLVCNSGKYIGRSFEIVEGQNSIYIDENHVNIFYDSLLPNGIVAELTADVLKNKFYIFAKDGREVVINGQVSRNGIIRNYDVCEINSVKFVFVELMTAFVNWGI